MYTDNNIKAEHIGQDGVNDYFRVFNTGTEDVIVSFPRSMGASAEDAISYNYMYNS